MNPTSRLALIAWPALFGLLILGGCSSPEDGGLLRSHGPSDGMPDGPSTPGASNDPAKDPAATPAPVGPTCRTAGDVLDLAKTPLTGAGPLYKISAEGGLLQKSADGGKTFATVGETEVGTVMDFAVAPKLVVAVRQLPPAGSTSYAIRKSVDDGATWSQAGTFTTGAAGATFKLAVAAAGEIYVLRTSTLAAAEGAVMHRITATGAEGDVMVVPRPANQSFAVSDLHVMASGTVLAAVASSASTGGSYVSSTLSYMQSTDQGQTWSPLTTVTGTVPNKLGSPTITSDRTGQIYPAYLASTTSLDGTAVLSQKIVVTKGTAAFTALDTYTPTNDQGIYLGFITTSADADGNVRVAFQQSPKDGATPASSIKSIVRKIAPGGVVTSLDVTRTGADYTYITRQAFTDQGHLLVEGYGYLKGTAKVTETFALGYACQ